MLHAKLTRIAMVLAFSALTVGCSSSTPEVSTPQKGLGSVSCSLEGTWERCTDNGGNSTMVRLSVSAGNLYETIEEFHSVADCSGANDGQFDFTASVVLGALGESASIAGGTDADLAPSVDLAGCGAGQPMYTTLKFNSGCTEFQISDSGPSCSPDSRGNAVAAQPFVKN